MAGLQYVCVSLIRNAWILLLSESQILQKKSLVRVSVLFILFSPLSPEPSTIRVSALPPLLQSCLAEAPIAFLLFNTKVFYHHLTWTLSII